MKPNSLLYCSVMNKEKLKKMMKLMALNHLMCQMRRMVMKVRNILLFLLTINIKEKSIVVNLIAWWFVAAALGIDWIIFRLYDNYLGGFSSLIERMPFLAIGSGVDRDVWSRNGDLSSSQIWWFEFLCHVSCQINYKTYLNSKHEHDTFIICVTCDMTRLTHLKLIRLNFIQHDMIRHDWHDY